MLVNHLPSDEEEVDRGRKESSEFQPANPSIREIKLGTFLSLCFNKC